MGGEPDWTELRQHYSTVAMCMENNVLDWFFLFFLATGSASVIDELFFDQVSILGVRELREGYTHIDDDRIHPGIQEAVEEMMRKGWIRTKEGFEDCKRTTLQKNDIVMMRILRDL